MPIIWTDSTWSRSRDGKAEIILFGRDYNDRTRTVRTVVTGFTPYFYVSESVRPGERRNPVWHEVCDTVYTDALGRPIRQVNTKLPSDIPKAREFYEWTDEADILFDKRFLIDNKISYSYEKEDSGRVVSVEVDDIQLPRISFFDIEVKSEDGSMPKPESPIHPIVSIQLLDSYTNDIVIFTYGVPQQSTDQVVCKSETELLSRFATYISKIDPDVLTGWYSNKFDLPYIIRRAALLDADISLLSRIPYRKPDVKNTKNGWFIRITGRQCFDFYDAFKKYYAPKGQLESYGLKDVISNKSVMKDKAYSYTDYGDSIVKLFENEEWDIFLQYCRNDVIALRDIDDTLNLVEFYEHLRKITGVKLEETLLNSRVIESVIMRDGIKPMPTKNYSDRGSESFEGAVVLSPPVGIHKNVGVVDLAALYPTIIVGFDISPDIDHVIPRAIKTIMEEREKLRALNRTNGTDVTKNKEQVMKYLANSFYGVIGWSKFRLYNIEQAATITRIGRELNGYLQELTRENGYEPLYGDTDSVFIGGIKSVDDGLRIEKIFNDKLSIWAREHGSSIPFTLKFEKFYSRLMFKKKQSGEVAKKRYAGHLIWKDGEPKDELSSSGMEIKRSDQSHITKQLLQSFFTKCLVEDNREGAIHEIKRTIDDVRNGRVSIHDVSIPKGVKDLTRDEPWSRGVLTLKIIFDKYITEGVKPRLIYILGDRPELCITPDIDESVVLQKVTVDWYMCCDKTVINKMKTFVESIGYDWDRVIEGQRGLEQWM